MSLLTEFRDKARRRGALGADEAVTLASAFRVVRDLPYAPATNDAPEAALHEWRGTAFAKHALLEAILDGLGTDCALILATHHFSVEDTPWLPPALLDEVRRGPVPDVHTFLRVCSDPVADEWMTVDATWPRATRTLGLPVNETLTPDVDQRIACMVEEIVHIPGDEEPADVYQRILALHAEDELERHDRFIDALSSWLAAATGDVR